MKIPWENLEDFFHFSFWQFRLTDVNELVTQTPCEQFRHGLTFHSVYQLFLLVEIMSRGSSF